MEGVPARCLQCRHTFVSRAFVIEGISNVSLSGNSVNCPRCGGTAKLVEGTFDFVDDTIRAKVATKESLDILATLKLALADAQNGNKTTEQIIGDIKQKSPELAESFQTIVNKDKGGLAALAAAILYLITSCTQNTHATLDTNLAIDQLHTYATGAAPYPFEEFRHQERAHTQSQASDEQRTSTPISRQQKRQQERQSKKRQPRSKPPERRRP